MNSQELSTMPILRGVPILGTTTAGLRACILDGHTGRLVEPNNARKLAQALQEEAAAPQVLRKMGIAALEAAHAMTHQKMHRDRQQLLFNLLGNLAPGKR